MSPAAKHIQRFRLIIHSCEYRLLPCFHQSKRKEALMSPALQNACFPDAGAAVRPHQNSIPSFPHGCSRARNCSKPSTFLLFSAIRLIAQPHVRLNLLSVTPSSDNTVFILRPTPLPDGTGLLLRRSRNSALRFHFGAYRLLLNDLRCHKWGLLGALVHVVYRSHLCARGSTGVNDLSPPR